MLVLQGIIHFFNNSGTLGGALQTSHCLWWRILYFFMYYERTCYLSYFLHYIRMTFIFLQLSLYLTRDLPLSLIMPVVQGGGRLTLLLLLVLTLLFSLNKIKKTQVRHEEVKGSRQFPAIEMPCNKNSSVLTDRDGQTLWISLALAVTQKSGQPSCNMEEEHERR